jgi:hypothetical protein
MAELPIHPSSMLGFQDPLGFTKDMSFEEIKRFRESEVTTAALLCCGHPWIPSRGVFPPFFRRCSLRKSQYSSCDTHLAQVQEVAPAFFVALTVDIATTDLFPADEDWKAAGVNLSVFWRVSMRRLIAQNTFF